MLLVFEDTPMPISKKKGGGGGGEERENFSVLEVRIQSSHPLTNTLTFIQILVHLAEFDLKRQYDREID